MYKGRTDIQLAKFSPNFGRYNRLPKISEKVPKMFLDDRKRGMKSENMSASTTLRQVRLTSALYLQILCRYFWNIFKNTSKSDPAFLGILRKFWNTSRACMPKISNKVPKDMKSKETPVEKRRENITPSKTLRQVKIPN